ncbi:MAG: hypothetical protein KIT68_08540 [Phycisphaeraceae bacterium]|nr:hypothetical protein [Phycisphaeraceae bacterium]
MAAQPAAAGPTPLTVWLLPEQADLVAAIASAAGCSIAAVGTPAVGRAQELAARFEARPLDDLRNAISSASPGLFLIAASGTFGRPGQALDGEVLLSARQRGVLVASFDPLPASLSDLHASGLLPPIDESAAPTGHAPGAMLAWAAVGPPARAWGPCGEMLDLLPSFGPVRTGSIQCLAPATEGGLGARLLDAMDLASAIFGEPETIDASFANPLLTRNVHATPGESLHGLDGDLTANLRFTGGRSCCVLASNQGAAWDVSVTLIGPGGRLTCGGGGVQWLTPSGSPAGATPKPAKKNPRPRQPKPDGTSERARTVAEHLAALARAGPSGVAGFDLPLALAMAQAALLSARTGECERPATMLRMAGV